VTHLALILAASISALVAAQQAVTEITAEQVEQYKVKLEAGCVKDALRGGLEVTRARAFCSCSIKHVGENMSFAEWQSASLQSSQQAEIEEMKILAPHIRKAAAACQSAVK